MKIAIEISETLREIASYGDAKMFSHPMWQAKLMDSIKNGIPVDTPEDCISREDAITYCSVCKLERGLILEYLRDAKSVVSTKPEQPLTS